MATIVVDNVTEMTAALQSLNSINEQTIVSMAAYTEIDRQIPVDINTGHRVTFAPQSISNPPIIRGWKFGGGAMRGNFGHLNNATSVNDTFRNMTFDGLRIEAQLFTSAQPEGGGANQSTIMADGRGQGWRTCGTSHASGDIVGYSENGGMSGLILNNCTGVIVQNCLIKGYANAVRVVDSTNTQIIHNEFSENHEDIIKVADFNTLRIEWNKIGGYRNIPPNIGDLLGGPTRPHGDFVQFAFGSGPNATISHNQLDDETEELHFALIGNQATWGQNDNFRAQYNDSRQRHQTFMLISNTINPTVTHNKCSSTTPLVNVGPLLQLDPDETTGNDVTYSFNYCTRIAPEGGNVPGSWDSTGNQRNNNPNTYPPGFIHCRQNLVASGAEFAGRYGAGGIPPDPEPEVPETLGTGDVYFGEIVQDPNLDPDDARRTFTIELDPNGPGDGAFEVQWTSDDAAGIRPMVAIAGTGPNGGELWRATSGGTGHLRLPSTSFNNIRISYRLSETGEFSLPSTVAFTEEVPTVGNPPEQLNYIEFDIYESFHHEGDSLISLVYGGTGETLWGEVSAFQASGGDSVVDSGGSRYHVFDNTANFSVTLGSKVVNYAIIGGGAAGGVMRAGGGGAGKLKTGTFNAGLGNHPVVIGSAGIGGTTGGATASNIKVWISADGARDPDDCLAIVVGVAQALKTVSEDSGYEIAAVVMGDTTHGSKYRMLNPTGSLPGWIPPDSLYENTAKNRDGAGNLAFFREYAVPAFNDLGIDTYDAVGTDDSEAALSWQLASSPSLGSLSDAAQALVEDIEQAMATTDAKVVYSAGGGANIPAEAIGYLLGQGHTKSQIAEHFAIIQHGSNNFMRQYEPTSRTRTVELTIAITTQGRTEYDNGWVGPGLETTVTNVNAVNATLFGPEFVLALDVPLGNEPFTRTLPAYATFGTGVDGSDCGSHAFACDRAPLLAAWDTARMLTGEVLDEGSDYLINAASGPDRERRLYNNFTPSDVMALFNGTASTALTNLLAARLAGQPDPVAPQAGGTSSVFGVTAAGGGMGGSNGSPPGSSGGCGGGGAGSTSAGNNGGGTTDGGTAGGNGAISSTNSQKKGGGGGGNGSAGANGTTTQAGAGGSGVSVNTPTPEVWGAGGGGGTSAGDATWGAGGSSGAGGKGGAQGSPAGSATTAGSGGGGSGSSGALSGSGAKGKCVIWYSLS